MIRKLLSSLKNIKQSHEDARLGRQLIGQDQYGNKYYQYFDSQGRQTRRMSENNDKNAPYIDPLWEEWIRNKRDKPYTQEEIESMTQQHYQYTQKVNQYEQKDADMLNQFKQQKTYQQKKKQEFDPKEWYNKNKL